MVFYFFIGFFVGISLLTSPFLRVCEGEIMARAAVVMESEGEKILYAKNPGLKQPPASTTKLVTAMVVMDYMKPEEIVTVSKKASSTSSVRPRLKGSEQFTVEDLLYVTLMKSDNGAAVALGEAVSGSERAFVEKMNEKAYRLGARNTRFINASGLPGPGQYITAHDLAKIMNESLRYPLIRKIILTKVKKVHSLDGRSIFLTNTNKLLWSEDNLLGGKTGYTRSARHCLAFAAEKGDSTLVAAVLGESRRSTLWQDAKKLISRGFTILTDELEPIIYFENIKKKSSSLSPKAQKKKKKRIRRVKMTAEKNVKVKLLSRKM